MTDISAPPTSLRGWPTDSDLAARIESCGVVDTDCQQFQAIDLAAKIEAAIDTFEECTRWTPFLAGEEPTTRTYDWPAGGYLNLDGGLVSLTSVASGGQALTAGLHYVPKPDNAPQRKKPYTSLALRAGLSLPLGMSYGFRRTVEVTGVWGCVNSVPAGVFEAVLGYAAALCVPELALSISSGLYKMDDIQFAGSGVTPLSSERAMWEAAFQSAVTRFKRIVL